MSAAVIFEDLRWWARPLVWWYLRRGRTVYYFRTSDDAPAQGWFQRAEATGRLLPLVVRPTLYVGHNESGGLAFATMDRAWAHFAESGVMRRARRLYGDRTIDLAFKKVLLQRLMTFFFLELLMQRAAAAVGGGRPLFVAANHTAALEDGRYRRLLAGPSVVARPACRFPWWQRVTSVVYAVAEATGGRVLILRRLAGCVYRSGQGARRPAAPRDVRVGVLLVNPLRQFANEVRGVDFLADGEMLRPSEVALVTTQPIAPAIMARLGERGLTVALAGRAFRPALLARVVREALALAAWERGPAWLVVAGWSVTEDYGIWTSFAARYHVREFVTHADHGYRHVGRTLVLRRVGTRSWYYIDSWNYNNIYPTPTGEPYRHWLWAYLCYDVLVSWNDRITEYFRSHDQQVDRYVTIGCLWAEHVRMFREGTLASAARARMFEHLGPVRRIVSVFPAWYMDNGNLNPMDGFVFTEHVRRLLDDFPDIGIVVKEKTPRWFFSRHPSRAVRQMFGGASADRIYRAYDEMEALDRCHFPGHTLSASELIAASDVVISYPFTSTTYEALASGVKAMFHDPCARLVGSMYEPVPGLVTHSYDELVARLRVLLDGTPDAEYIDYLQKHFVGAFERDLDGRALTRFRALLTGTPVDDIDPITPPREA